MSADLVRKTEKILNMLASPHPGERANAGAMLGHLATEHRDTITGFLRHTLALPVNDTPIEIKIRVDTPDADLLKVMEGLNLKGRGIFLNDWETSFVDSILERKPYQLSEKQRHVVLSIISKMT